MSLPTIEGSTTHEYANDSQGFAAGPDGPPRRSRLGPLGIRPRLIGPASTHPADAERSEARQEEKRGAAAAWGRRRRRVIAAACAASSPRARDRREPAQA